MMMPSQAAPGTITVYFIRHGTSEWNLLKKWQGQTDTLLAPEGELQAQKGGAALHAAGVRFDAVRCSDLRRAARTAAVLTAACGVTVDNVQVKPLVDARLRECSLGVFEGLHRDEIFGPRFASLFARLAALPHESRIRTAYFDDLETPLQISTRALAAASELAAQVPQGGTVACVTHSVILESLLAAAFCKDFEAVYTNTLAWLRCTYEPSTGFVLEETSGARMDRREDARGLQCGRASCGYAVLPDALRFLSSHRPPPPAFVPSVTSRRLPPPSLSRSQLHAESRRDRPRWRRPRPRAAARARPTVGEEYFLRLRAGRLARPRGRAGWRRRARLLGARHRGRQVCHGALQGGSARVATRVVRRMWAERAACK